MTDANTFFQHIYEDYPLTLSGFGGKRQVRAGGVTKVDVSPSTKIDAKPANDGPGAKGYTKETDPARNRPGHVEQAKQPYSPSNPQSRWQASWAKAGLEQSTRAAKSRQSGNYKNRQS